jgi:(2R)-3-sulfolactate dehydrogenase (NADP+)
MSRAATETLSLEVLEALIGRALERQGTSAGNAASTARALALAEADGQSGHGVSRVLSYAAQVRSGKVDGHAVPVVTRSRSGLVAIDAALGFAYPALDRACDLLPEVTRAQGVAAAGIARSHHAGALGLFTERLAGEGLVALMLANTPSAMAAAGGRSALLGTNPIAFAAPRGGGRPPIVVDLALSEVARGRIVTAAAKGEAIPAGWALDREGRPTTDAKAALSGTLLPAGGAKGAALALMVEAMAAALTGGRLAGEATSFLDAEGAPPATGQLIIAIDAEAFAGLGGGTARIEALAAMIEAEPPARMPGARRHELRQRARLEGVKIDQGVLAQVRALAADA